MIRYIYSGVFIIIVLSLSQSASAQITGLWQVKTQMVGTAVRTPDARWMKFEPSGWMKAGHGWQQHTYSSYKYDAERNLLSLENENTYEPYKVIINDSSMTWTRVEDGYKVNIKLKKIASLPKSTADKITGGWQVKKSSDDNRIVTNSFQTGNEHLFFRWDGRYIYQNENSGRETGFWYADPHYPELKLISENDSIQSTEWRVSFTDVNTMILESKTGEKKWALEKSNDLSTP